MSRSPLQAHTHVFPEIITTKVRISDTAIATNLSVPKSQCSKYFTAIKKSRSRAREVYDEHGFLGFRVEKQKISQF